MGLTTEQIRANAAPVRPLGQTFLPMFISEEKGADPSQGGRVTTIFKFNLMYSVLIEPEKKL